METLTKVSTPRTLTLSLTLLAVLACSPSPSQMGHVVGVDTEQNSLSSAGGSGGKSPASNNNSQLLQKINIDVAMLEDIKPHKIDCVPDGSGDNPKICILICHVPPGNLSAAQDKVIPLQALAAHIKHGLPASAHRDYLGSCIPDADTTTTDPNNPIDTTLPEDNTTPTDTTTPADPLPPTDPTTPAPTDTLTDTSTETPTTDVIPIWCQSYITIDSNCDGINDLTGDPLL